MRQRHYYKNTGWLLFLIVVVLPFLGFSNTTDSLTRQLNNSNSDTTKAILYLQIAKSLQQTNVDSAITIATRGVNLSKSVGYTIGIAENQALLGDLYISNDQLELGKQKYFLAIALFEELGMDFDYAETKMVIGNIYSTQNKNVEALKIYQECLNIAIDKNFSDLIPHLYNNIGVVYVASQDYTNGYIN